MTAREMPNYSIWSFEFNNDFQQMKSSFNSLDCLHFLIFCYILNYPLLKWRVFYNTYLYLCTQYLLPVVMISVDLLFLCQFPNMHFLPVWVSIKAHADSDCEYAWCLMSVCIVNTDRNVERVAGLGPLAIVHDVHVLASCGWSEQGQLWHTQRDRNRLVHRRTPH